MGYRKKWSKFAKLVKSDDMGYAVSGLAQGVASTYGPMKQRQLEEERENRRMDKQQEIQEGRDQEMFRQRTHLDMMADSQARAREGVAAQNRRKQGLENAYYNNLGQNPAVSQAVAQDMGNLEWEVEARNRADDKANKRGEFAPTAREQLNGMTVEQAVQDQVTKKYRSVFDGKLATDPQEAKKYAEEMGKPKWIKEADEESTRRKKLEKAEEMEGKYQSWNDLRGQIGTDDLAARQYLYQKGTELGLDKHSTFEVWARGPQGAPRAKEVDDWVGSAAGDAYEGDFRRAVGQLEKQYEPEDGVEEQPVEEESQGPQQRFMADPQKQYPQEPAPSPGVSAVGAASAQTEPAVGSNAEAGKFLTQRGGGAQVDSTLLANARQRVKDQTGSTLPDSVLTKYLSEELGSRGPAPATAAPVGGQQPGGALASELESKLAANRASAVAQRTIPGAPPASTPAEPVGPQTETLISQMVATGKAADRIAAIELLKQNKVPINL